MWPSRSIPPWNPHICNFYFEENTWNGKGYVMPLIVMKTYPCQWLVKGGGCATCGYNLVAALEQEVTPRQLLDQVDFVTKTLPASHFPFITLTSSGSFMDQREIDDKTRLKILNLLDSEGYEHLNFESRPDVLRDEERLQKLHEAFRGSISVGIGLESRSDFVRRFCLNKGYTTRVFEEAVRTLKKSGISYDAYVLCGKPFLSPREDIEDALTTIKFAFDKGCKWAIIMVANLQPYTLVYFMREQGLYSLPKLWTPLEIIRRLPKSLKKRIILKGIDKALPYPLAFASNCNYCTSTIVNAQRLWNLTQDYQFLEEVMDSCECKREWEQELDDGIDMKERTRAYYKTLCELLEIPFE
jgi:radical SAM enzyme (TIGR01210 family)